MGESLVTARTAVVEADFQFPGDAGYNKTMEEAIEYALSSTNE